MPARLSEGAAPEVAFDKQRPVLLLTRAEPLVGLRRVTGEIGVLRARGGAFGVLSRSGPRPD